MKNICETNVIARIIVWDMLRDAADEDYAVARWAFACGLTYQFWWSSQQSIEKSLKSILLLNNRSIANYRHELKKPLEEVMTLAWDLLPGEIKLPHYFPKGVFGTSEPEQTIDFVARVETNGSTSNRYRLFSNSVSGPDLHKLDSLYFLLRRLTYPLNMKYEDSDQTFRQLLIENRKFHPHEPFRRLTQNDEKKPIPLLPSLKMNNFSFFEDEAIGAKRVFSSMRATNSPWSVWKNFKNYRKESSEALHWAADSLKMTRNEREEIKRFIASLGA